MDYLKKYKSFLYSYYLSSGVRITAGVILPAVIFSFFDMLAYGVAVSLGAMCVSGTDNPGPIHHRRNGMLVCLLFLVVVASLTSLTASYPVLLGILITVFCFVFSMIGVYGSRAISIGVSALLIMVLQIGHPGQGKEVLIQAAYILLGGLWYTGLSLLLHKFAPYRLAQQALGECIAATANYIRIRALFYDTSSDFNKAYRQMIEQQVIVHQEQELVRELLFKSRYIVKESTNTGRTLLFLFRSLVDLFEKIITTYHDDYKELHEMFADTEIMSRYRELIMLLAAELDDISIAVKSGRRSRETNTLANAIKETRRYYIEMRNKKRTPETLEYFIALRNILSNIEDIANRIHSLHLYTSYRQKVTTISESDDFDRFVQRQDFSFKVLTDNLSLQSNYFRHSLRVSLATLAGYIISQYLQVGHNYWILLTIIVILKPNYSLTKKRNFERLFGTIAGAVAGLIILYFIKDKTVLFVIMLLLALGTYSLLRTNYMLSVIFMTPYVLLIFQLLYNTPLKNVLTDRLIDTSIGSAIAFIANLLLVPVWEHEQISGYIATAIEKNTAWFKTVVTHFMGKPVLPTEYRVSRKDAFVALGNLSDAFTRMLAEPKWQQKNLTLIHQFVVYNHLLTSHIATLSHFGQQFAAINATKDFIPVINYIETELCAAKAIINGEEAPAESARPANWQQIDKRVTTLMLNRQKELQQGLTDTDTRHLLLQVKSVTDEFRIIHDVTTDIKKSSLQLKEATS
ncbi:FUSC family protein [Longitalea luteola]|uniref:FUSC family protein n=1 Tax=Longitalea luteola TaxID=2812563 RepID=UPI001A969392|nr:FUSC family membrane protein [Longitalea luteola]